MQELYDLLNKIDFEFSYIDRVYSSRKKMIVNRWILFLPGGCSWAREKNGGCFMCNFTPAILELTQGKKFSSEEVFEIFKMGYSRVKNSRFETLFIYSGGSFLNSKEITLDNQIKMCGGVKDISSLDTFMVESRPEFITQKRIQTLTSELGDKELMVGIGLECEDDKIREYCINKGFSRKDYEKAVKILKDNNAKVKTYVFIKPLYLSEKQTIDEAIKTAKYAFDSGSDEITFEAALVQKGTKMEKEYKLGNYRPPWIWSIIEVLKETNQLGAINLGDFIDVSSPVAIPYNCPECSSKFSNLFKIYRESGDINIFDKTDCSCKKKWKRGLK